MITVTKNNFTEEIEESLCLCVIDLYADWCVPCKMLSPVISELESEFSHIKFAKINVDEEPELAAAFHVSSIPMVAFVRDNTFLDFTVGVVPGEELAAKIKEYM